MMIIMQVQSPEMIKKKAITLTLPFYFKQKPQLLDKDIKWTL